MTFFRIFQNQQGVMFGRDFNLRKAIIAQRGAMFGRDFNLCKATMAQRGAMFGLDARISLAIFGALSVIAGAYTALNMHGIHADSFSQELAETAQAIEAIHNDLRRDVHSSLLDNTDGNAFRALYDGTVLNDDIRGRWLGPYIKMSTPVHPKYGEARIQRRASSALGECVPEDVCYLWLRYDTVHMQIAKALNEIFDGNLEIEPALEGRIQWQGGATANTVVLSFRTSRALGGVGYF